MLCSVMIFLTSVAAFSLRVTPIGNALLLTRAQRPGPTGAADEGFITIITQGQTVPLPASTHCLGRRPGTQPGDGLGDVAGREVDLLGGREPSESEPQARAGQRLVEPQGQQDVAR